MTSPSPAELEADYADRAMHYACGRCYPLPWNIGEVKRTRCGLTKIFDAVMRDVPMCVVCREMHRVYPCSEGCVTE